MLLVCLLLELLRFSGLESLVVPDNRLSSNNLRRIDHRLPYTENFKSFLYSLVSLSSQFLHLFELENTIVCSLLFKFH